MSSSTVHAAPHRRTSVPVLHADLDINIVVSSIKYTTTTPSWTESFDETCVFFPNGRSDGRGRSEVRGSYDDHDAIVAELRGDQ